MMKLEDFTKEQLIEAIKSQPSYFIRTKDFFKDMIFRIYERKGKPKGFTECARGMCSFQKEKVKMCESKIENTMLGICYDEPERMHEGRHSILFENKITQRMAYDICKSNGMLSPLYELGVKRDGCFFCPNASRKEIRLLNANQIDLINKWVSMTPPGAYLSDDWRKHIDDYFQQLSLF